MIANTENIQLIYNDYPNTFVVDGARIDNYGQSDEHFEHGWREVVIPEIGQFQKLSDEYVLKNDIVTKEVIDFTEEEIEAYNRSLVPRELSRMKFKKQIRRSTIYSYDIVLEYLKNLTITETFTEDDRQDIVDDFEDCTYFERYSQKFIIFANKLGISDELKDEIFINGNLIE